MNRNRNHKNDSTNQSGQRDPRTGAPLSVEYWLNTVVRLETKIETHRRKGECWRFAGASLNGYGSLVVKNANVFAHRLVAAIYLGLDIYDLNGLQVHHSCGVRKCCNPAHLYVPVSIGMSE